MKTDELLKGGTTDQALLIASDWLEHIHRDGFPEVYLLPDFEMVGGMWTFTFKHSVTGKTATLRTSGLTVDQCERFAILDPRTYWNGSSNDEPNIYDWMPEGWSFRVEFYRSK